MGSVHANDLGGAEGVEAVHEGDTDLDFGGLSVRVSCGDAFPECLEVEPVSATGSSEPARASLPRSGFGHGFRSSVSETRSAVVSGGAQGVVAGSGRPAVLIPRPPVLADRDDRSGLAVDDGGMAASGVIGTVRSHGGADRLDVSEARG